MLLIPYIQGVFKVIIHGVGNHCHTLISVNLMVSGGEPVLLDRRHLEEEWRTLAKEAVRMSRTEPAARGMAQDGG